MKKLNNETVGQQIYEKGYFRISSKRTLDDTLLPKHFIVIPTTFLVNKENFSFHKPDSRIVRYETHSKNQKFGLCDENLHNILSVNERPLFSRKISEVLLTEFNDESQNLHIGIIPVYLSIKNIPQEETVIKYDLDGNKMCVLRKISNGEIEYHILKMTNLKKKLNPFLKKMNLEVILT